MRRFLLLFAILLSCCSADRNAQNAKQVTEQSTVDGAQLLTITDAVAILGEPGHTVDSIYSSSNGVTRFNSGYKANYRDKKSGDTGAVYFVFEEYEDANAAHDRYSFIMEANRHNGIREIKNMGDEAYYHTDNTHFRFIMARKNNRIVVMKINKMTAYTSDEAFYKITERIVVKI